MEKPSATFIPEGQGGGDLQSYRKTPAIYAISDHPLQCNYAINFDDCIILTTISSKFKLLLWESLLIKGDKPVLNRTIKSFPIELFD